MAEYKVYILEYQSTQSAEAGTSSSQIKITGHGLSALDMIVNTTRRGRDAERGSRPVHSVGGDADTIPIEVSMTGQTTGDSIRLYKYTERTSILKPGTFRLVRRGGGQSECSFEIVTTASYLVHVGQYIRVDYVDGSATTRFKGVVSSVKRKPAFDGSTTLFLSIQCQNLKNVASRRTIRIDYPEGTLCGDIVSDMVTDYLFQEGIRESTIDNGATLDEAWQDDVISIADVLDQCATKSGFQWFIDDEGLMNFYQDVGSPSAAAHALDGTWNAYKNLEVGEDINNYINKSFVAGGTDEKGNPIIFGAEDFNKSTEMQEITAGTGVYGTINRDTSIVESDYKTSEASSTTTTINVTAHGQDVGDVIWNFTRDEYRQILTVPSVNQFTVDAFSNMTARSSKTAGAATDTTNINISSHGLSVGQMVYNSTRSAYRNVLKVIDADNFLVETVASQTSGDSIYTGGDIIVFFTQANDLITNTFKRQGTLPMVITFETSANDFEPGTKLTVNLSNIGVSTSYFFIEDVEIYDVGDGLSHCWSKIKAVKRDNSNFSTQRSLSGFDYWRDR